MTGQERADAAKAGLTEALAGPDPESVPHEAIADFHHHLGLAIAECSATNVQYCHNWLVRHCFRSNLRWTSLLRYLAALSASLEPPSTAPRLSSHRQCLHILYCLHDALHGYKFHSNAGNQAELAGDVAETSRCLSEIASRAAAAPSNQRRLHARLDNLIALWRQQHLLPAAVVAALDEAVALARANAATYGGNPAAGSLAAGRASSRKPSSSSLNPRETTLPPFHGDLSSLPCDLPAGNMIPLIQSSRSSSITSSQLRPVPLPSGPADPALVDAVDSFLQRINLLFDPRPEGTEITDVDPLGGKTLRGTAHDGSPKTIEPLTYYGWSADFCARLRPDRDAPARPRRSSGSDSWSGRSDPDWGDKSRRRNAAGSDA